MSVIDQLASSQGRRDEIPNQELAQALAQAEDTEAIQELMDSLFTAKQAIQNDCIKVLYEIGESNPHLIAPYVNEFVRLLSSKNNRLVWGGMTALGLIADEKSADIWEHIDTILQATTDGSVITQDWGIRVLATLSSKDTTYEARIFPFLLDFLASCRPKDLPRHAESCLIAVTADNQAHMLKLLEKRLPSLKASQAKRVDKVIRQIQSL